MCVRKEIGLTNISSRFGTSNQYLNREQINNINFKSTKQEQVEREKRKDIYAQMPIRALGYTNELGEAIRPLSPMLANLSWLPAIGYISADIADKYRQDEYAEHDPSKKRASKQFVTQLLASVMLPTLAVKAGQGITNSLAMMSKTGLSLNHKEKISDTVINSMKRGEHKNYLDAEGQVDKDAYKQAMSKKLDEILKHRKTHKQNQNPIRTVINYLKKPFIIKPKSENVKEYANTIIDRLVDERQQLLDDIKPEKLSQKSFNKFQKIVKNLSVEEKQSVAFDTVRKMEKSRMFNNRILKSIGGLAALSLMAKPIDKFVEHIIVGKYVGPTIDKVKNPYNRRVQISQDTGINE